MRLSCCLICVVLLGRLAAVEFISTRAAKEMVSAYITADSDEKRQALIAEMADRDYIKKVKDIDGLVKQIRSVLLKELPKLEIVDTDLLANLDEQRRQFNTRMGIARGIVATVDTEQGAMRTIINGKPAANKPLLIFLHGGGHTPGHPGKLDNEMAWGWGMLRAPGIAVTDFSLVPRCLSDEAVNAWVLENDLQAVMTVIDQILLRYPVDSNRVYVAGISMGGYGVWNLAAIESDRFAAIASMAAGNGRNNSKGFENMQHLPFGVFIGEKDTSRIGSARKGIALLEQLKKQEPEHFPYYLKTYPLADHMMPDESYKDVSDFFAQHKRTLPKEFHWHPQVSWKKRFYYVGIDKPEPGMSVHVKITDNVVAVETTAVKAMTLSFNDELVDLDKPIRITLNGAEVHNEIVPRRFGTLLQSLYARPDMYLYASVELKP